MQLDQLHYAILNELQLNARMSNAEIGRRIGLTAPAVAERIKKMQEEGIIKSFTAAVEFSKLDYLQRVMIAIKLPPDNIPGFLKEAEKTEGITKIVHTTGEYCFFIDMVLKSTEELVPVLNKLRKFGETTTFSILAVPVDSKAVRL
ncbi:Lrp/AsnC family transcriptional regulator [Chryseobacterium oranimense]|uniref:Lrp/AsnC family transcriptional regulator n=1 Tax=Chryseobacterium oranimense TaxID=421058 RepID=UPI0021AFE3C6|nr:Lrp/AsnC family transcriptional regulator [Chryseobacterium oranimense]UWX61518.1 Lrp/AsnC family transcriptional regulator [Chryseobacterium oranimense]